MMRLALLAAVMLLLAPAHAHRHLLQDTVGAVGVVEPESDGIPGPPDFDPAGAGKMGGHYRYVRIESKGCVLLPAWQHVVTPPGSLGTLSCLHGTLGCQAGVCPPRADALLPPPTAPFAPSLPCAALHAKKPQVQHAAAVSAGGGDGGDRAVARHRQL
jgi:hypothetical protein